MSAINIEISQSSFSERQCIDIPIRQRCKRTPIVALRPDFVVEAILDSIESGVEWFSQNELPDLIFSDIQLGDGLAFEMLQKVDIRCPVIFCTAYEEYALQAFQNNGIDYLLKPIEEKQLRKPLESGFYKTLLQQVMREIESQSRKYKGSFLVSYRDKLIPIRVDDIAYFKLEAESTQLITMDNKRYIIPLALEHLERQLDPKLFFRANRQHLVAHKVIREVEHFFDRKLLIKLALPTDDPLVVSKARASEFLRWMENC